MLEIGENETWRKEFVLSAIREHKSSDMFSIATAADMYYRHRNPTIMRYQKYINNRFGQKVPDVWSPNNKIASNWYHYFVTQAVTYLLGNGVTFGEKQQTKSKLGDDFDRKINEAATAAKNGGVAFGFWNHDHLEVFNVTEFAPLWDEEDGALKAGVRFWQIDDTKPLRATLYELDGYTDYIQLNGEKIEVLHKKRNYRHIVRKNIAEGETIFDGENYPCFPVVPLWNVNKQSELCGNRGTLDAYDLMISGLINNVSEGEFIYWILKNCNGMNPEDDIEFIEQLKLTHVAHADGDDGASVDAHNVNVSFEATSEALNRLQEQLFNDFMAVNVQNIAAGNITATQIKAAYEPLNQKTDQFEICVTEFIVGVLALAGIDDTPTYTRSQMSNQSETLEMVLQSAEYLDDEYITTKLLTLLGDSDKVDEVLKRKQEEAAQRYQHPEPAPESEGE